MLMFSSLNQWSCLCSPKMKLDNRMVQSQISSLLSMYESGVHALKQKQPREAARIFDKALGMPYLFRLLF